MKLKLPLILSASDYHEFDDQLDVINKVAVQDNGSPLKTKIKFEELGFYSGSDGRAYHAVFFDGKKPSPVELFKLIAKEEKLNSERKINSFIEDNDEDAFNFIKFDGLQQVKGELRAEGFFDKPQKKTKLKK